MTAYHNGEPEEIVKQLMTLLPEKSHVLDIGCGEGRNALPLARSGFHVEAWDNSAKEVRHLREQAKREGLCITSYDIDMRSLYIGFNRWNAILTIHCLHFLDPKAAEKRLEHIRLNLKRGGFHAMVALTCDSPMSKERKDRYFPTVDELLDLYKGWEILVKDPGDGQLTLLARKPA